MKRDYNHHHHNQGSSGNGHSVKPESSSMASSNKAKMWEDQQDAGMDELLAVLGYKVRTSDMADVAQKLEQLEMVMGTAQEDDLSHLSWDTAHYNPSDMSGWLETMISGLNNSDPAGVSTSDYDLRAIPGVAAYPPQSESPLEMENCRKRLKTAAASGSSPSDPIRPLVLLDSEENGVRLVHTLMACAEAVEQDNMKVADAFVKHIGLLAVSQSGSMRKVATYFAEALARRIYKIFPPGHLNSFNSDVLQMHFYESSPYLKFAHFTANQAILESFTTSNRVHVVDFGLKQGMQWPALIQALARRPGGAPAFRFTGIGPPAGEGTDSVQQVGMKLTQLAETIGVEFDFRGVVVNSLADLDTGMLEIRPNEIVAVNSVFELHSLLARPGSIEKVLSTVKAIRPKIVTIVEQEANHNEPGFMARFTEALHYYSNLFDSLDGPPNQDLVMSEVYLGKQICNVVACEGTARVERHETLTQWRTRMKSGGFEPVHLGSNAFKQASMLLAFFAGGNGFRVEENDGALMLGWHTRPLIATSAWQLAAEDSV